jgi:hypothetical protein
VETVTRELPVVQEPIEAPVEADPQPGPTANPEGEEAPLEEALPSSPEQSNSL